MTFYKTTFSTEQKDTQYRDIQYNDTQLSGILHIETQYNGKQHEN